MESGTTKASPPMTSGAPGFEPDFDPAFLAQSRAPQIYAAVITVTVLATISVVLRFVCRWMVKARVMWDDWLIILSLLIEWGLSAVLLYETADLKFGRHVELLQQPELETFGKTLVATQLLYYCAQTAIKLSILLVYNRVFGVNRRFRMLLYAVGVLVLAWWLASCLDTIFQCIPVQAIWDKSIKNATCQNLRDSALGTGLSNLILDVLILALPTKMIWGLQVSKRVKLSLTFIFMLGVFVCAVSIIRIHQIFGTDFKMTDLTWDAFGINVWSTVESCCALIGANLVTMKPLITKARASPLNSRGNGSKSGHTKLRGSKVTISRPQASYQSLRDPERDFNEMKHPSSVLQTAVPPASVSWPIRQ